MTSKAPRRGPRAKPSPQRPRRTPGRPAADDGGRGDQRERIIEAALVCFGRTGIAAASLRAIAAEAHVTPALLHYYFGDKAQLQDAVVAERVLPAVAVLQAPLREAGEDMATLVAAFVHGAGRMVAERPWFPALWVREVLCQGGALRPLLLERIGPQVPRVMVERFARAQAEGRLNPDLDPRLLMVSLVGLTLFPLAGAPIWQALFEARDLDFDRLRQHTLCLLERGLELPNAS